MIPQLLFLALLTRGVVRSIEKHGEPKNLKYNARRALLTAIIWITITYYGGFWDVFL